MEVMSEWNPVDILKLKSQSESKEDPYFYGFLEYSSKCALKSENLFSAFFNIHN